MKLTYKIQLILSIILILLANILTELLHHWLFRSAGFAVCGLLWIIHPVLPHGAEVSKRTLLWVRLAGILLILIGIFTRVHL
ncbi:MAG: hypothetical protein E7579_01270 [Ruminococcaceae bacterium]|nr:hypothetical protein [Oscillospiraceae bacterium]